jgi:hypothetical protein
MAKSPEKAAEAKAEPNKVVHSPANAEQTPKDKGDDKEPKDDDKKPKDKGDGKNPPDDEDVPDDIV